MRAYECKYQKPYTRHVDLVKKRELEVLESIFVSSSKEAIVKFANSLKRCLTVQFRDQSKVGSEGSDERVIFTGKYLQPCIRYLAEMGRSVLRYRQQFGFDMKADEIRVAHVPVAIVLFCENALEALW